MAVQDKCSTLNRSSFERYPSLKKNKLENSFKFAGRTQLPYFCFWRRDSNANENQLPPAFYPDTFICLSIPRLGHPFALLRHQAY